jgi:hypothetical protein
MVMTRVTLMRAGVVLLTALLAVVCTAPVAAQQTTGNVAAGLIAYTWREKKPSLNIRVKEQFLISN